MSTTLTHDTPIGTLTLFASDTGITRVRFGARGDAGMSGSDRARDLLDRARRELEEYFDRRRTRFTVPIDIGRMDAERRAILDALGRVGYGETTTYGALAAELGLAGDGARRVGVAMARNPVPVLVACHRVLGKDGSLTGYAGGLHVKRALLELEGRDRAPAQLAPAV
jgi:methylated-DNA-[protein]-cysteine S-methyltransferase